MNVDARSALFNALAELAPAGTAPTWQSLARVAPPEAAPDAELVRRLSVSPPEAADVSPQQLEQAASRAIAVAQARRADWLHRLQKDQGGKVFGIALGLWVASAGVLAGARLFEPVDLAKDKPFRQSSMWNNVRCDPDHGVCGPLRTRIFFHTLDDPSPWVEIDLGEPKTFSRLTIVNRKDEGLQHRAVPLVIEVSDDQQTWKQVARQDEVFDTWEPKLEAPVKARFVRARADRKTWLHLEALKVHP